MNVLGDLVARWLALNGVSVLRFRRVCTYPDDLNWLSVGRGAVGTGGRVAGWRADRSVK